MDEKKQHPNPSELPEDLSVPQEMPALDPGVLPDEENTFFTAPAELFDEEPAAAETLPDAEELPAAEILPEASHSYTNTFYHKCHPKFHYLYINLFVFFQSAANILFRRI